MLFTNRGRWFQIFNEWENETHNDIHWRTNLHAARAVHLSQPAAETAFDGKLGPTHSSETAFQRPSMDHHMVVEWSTERSMAVDCCHRRKCQSDCPQMEVFEDRCRLIVETLTHTINRSHRQQWWTVEVETTLKVVKGHQWQWQWHYSTGHAYSSVSKYTVTQHSVIIFETSGKWFSKFFTESLYVITSLPAPYLTKDRFEKNSEILKHSI